MFTTNPKSGEISAVTAPLWSRLVSNARFAMFMFLSPLPSPKITLPLSTIKSPSCTFKPPLTLSDAVMSTLSAGVNISKPLSGDIIANAEPDVILSNCKSVKDSAGMLNNSEPSPENTDADSLTLTFISLGSMIASAEPDLILSNSKSVNDSAGILNKPLPSPL